VTPRFCKKNDSISTTFFCMQYRHFCTHVV